MDWLKKLSGFLGGVSNQAGRTIGNVFGGANQAVQQAQRTFGQPVQRVINQFVPPPRPQPPRPQLPKVQIPQFQLPTAPKINLNDFLRAINQTPQQQTRPFSQTPFSLPTAPNQAIANVARFAPTAQVITPQRPIQRPIQPTNTQQPNFINELNKNVQSFNERLLGGLGRGIIRTGEYVLPGKTETTSEAIIRSLFPEAGSKAGRRGLTPLADPNSFGGKLGTGAKAAVDIASIVLPSAAVTEALQGTQIASKFLQGGRLARLGTLAATEGIGGIPASLASIGIARGQQKPVNLPSEIGTGLVVDALTPLGIKLLGKGYKAIKGVITNVPASEVQKAQRTITNAIIDSTPTGVKVTAPTVVQSRVPVGKAQGKADPRVANVNPLAVPPKLPQVGKTAKTDPLESLKQEARKYKSAEEFVSSQFTKKPEYGMSHRPSYEGMPPAHNLLEGETLPRDVYTHPDYSISSGRIRSGDKAANESWSALQKIKDNPDAEITVYRAGAKNELNNGDWITFSKDYAKQSVEGTEKVHSFKIKAKDAVFAGDDINEFGYYPKEKLTDIYNQSKAPQVGKTAPIQTPVAPKVPIKAAVADQIAPGDIKISSAIDSKKPGLKIRGQEVREQFVNRFAPVEDLVSKIEKKSGTPLRPSKNPLSYVRQYLGGGGIANSKIDNQLTPIIKQTKQFDGLREYLVAKRMNELADRGMSKRADNVLEGINKKYGAEVGNFDKISKELYAYQNKQIDELVNVGVLTREAADNIRAKNQFYVPFNRVIPELEDFAGTMPGQAIGRNANPIKAIHGSDKDIIDPIESMIRNTYDIQATVQKQKVMRSLYELAPDEFAIPAKNSMNKNRVGMFIDGQKTMLETSEPLARSLNSMAEEQMNFAVRVMSLPAKTLRSGATSFNVAFALPNIVRDQLSAAANSKYGGVPIYDFVAGLASVIKKDDSYKRWITSGADQASLFAQDRTTLQRGVKDITGGLGYKAGKLVKSPLELFRILGQFSEKGSRVGVYKRAERGAMKQFGNAEEAALAAAKESREATIDFARRGSKMKAANSLIPFLNARLQGTLKLANSFKERPVQTGVIGMAVAGLPAAALYLHNSGYPEYAEIPDYIKRENFIIMTGNKETPFIKIPKGEVGKIFGNPVESFLAQLKSDYPNWKSTVASMVDSFLPVGSVEDPGKFVTDLMPTAASVPLQLTANFDTFRGMPIVSQYQKDLPPEQQFTKYNTETGKKIGAALGISPAKLEFGIGGLTGGLGRQALQLADIATGNKISTQDLPVISRFDGEQKDLNKSASKVYEDADKAKIAKARENFAIKQALEKGDTSVLKGLDKTTATRLKRTVAENQAKDKLTPIQKALFGLPKDQLDQLKQTGQYTDDIAVIEGIKETITQNIKVPKSPKIKFGAKGKLPKARSGRITKGRTARVTTTKAPRFRKITIAKGPRVQKTKQASFAKFRPTKSARKTIKIKA